MNFNNYIEKLKKQCQPVVPTINKTIELLAGHDMYLTEAYYKSKQLHTFSAIIHL